MSLCDCRGLFANDKEVARRRSGAASRDSDEVIHRKWLEGAAGLRQETVTKSFTKSTDKRADELISGSLGQR